ncbi:MAG: hypothetical protein AAB421_03835 [Patescibacteria group bacterium]
MAHLARVEQAAFHMAHIPGTPVYNGAGEIEDWKYEDDLANGVPLRDVLESDGMTAEQRRWHALYEQYESENGYWRQADREDNTRRFVDIALHYHDLYELQTQIFDDRVPAEMLLFCEQATSRNERRHDRRRNRTWKSQRVQKWRRDGGLRFNTGHRVAPWEVPLVTRKGSTWGKAHQRYDKREYALALLGY